MSTNTSRRIKASSEADAAAANAVIEHHTELAAGLTERVAMLLDAAGPTADRAIATARARLWRMPVVQVAHTEYDVAGQLQSLRSLGNLAPAHTADYLEPLQILMEFKVTLEKPNRCSTLLRHHRCHALYAIWNSVSIYPTLRTT